MPMMTTRASRTAVALTATLGLAASAWFVALRQMRGMDMGGAFVPDDVDADGRISGAEALRRRRSRSQDGPQWPRPGSTL